MEDYWSVNIISDMHVDFNSSEIDDVSFSGVSICVELSRWSCAWNVCETVMHVELSSISTDESLSQSSMYFTVTGSD